MTEPTSNMSSLTPDEFVDRYRAELGRLDYSDGTVQIYLRVVRQLLHLIDGHSIALADLTPDRAAELMQHWADRGKQATYDAFIARRFFVFLTSLGVIPSPALTAQELARAALRRDYEDYLRRHRGLSERTIAQAGAIVGCDQPADESGRGKEV